MSEKDTGACRGGRSGERREGGGRDLSSDARIRLYDSLSIFLSPDTSQKAVPKKTPWRGVRMGSVARDCLKSPHWFLPGKERFK